ncbi:MAG: hypothetical protein WA461_14490, partial [Nitrososphaeraceae archaeon]
LFRKLISDCLVNIEDDQFFTPKKENSYSMLGCVCRHCYIVPVFNSAIYLEEGIIILNGLRKIL